MLGRHPPPGASGYSGVWVLSVACPAVTRFRARVRRADKLEIWVKNAAGRLLALEQLEQRFFHISYRLLLGQSICLGVCDQKRRRSM
jgi:hypothetical protein